MLLIIEKSKEEVILLREEIDKMEESSKTQCSTEQFDKKVQELETNLTEFEMKTKEIKIKKSKETKGIMPKIEYIAGFMKKRKSHGLNQWKLSRIRNPQR